MKIELEELRRHREILGRIGDAVDMAGARAEFGNLSREDIHLIQKLAEIDELDWELLQEVLKETDLDLAIVVQLARKAAKSVFRDIRSSEPFQYPSRILSISFSPYLDLATGSQVIRLVFKTAEEPIISDQDLEDSLGIGASILDAVARSVGIVVEEFGIPQERIVWGDEFEERLALAERATSRLRRLYDKGSLVKGEPTSSPDDA